MPISSSNSSEASPAAKAGEDVLPPSKSLRERVREWREEEKRAKEEGLPRAEARHFFRVLSFGNRTDTILLIICGITSLAAGVVGDMRPLISNMLMKEVHAIDVPGSW
jgi:hypothetical protein